jgi:hypothetical protein
MVDAIGAISECLTPFLYSELVILGDINLHWLSPASNQFKSISIDFNLTQLISKPTRPNVKNPVNSLLIDLILTTTKYV